MKVNLYLEKILQKLCDNVITIGVRDQKLLNVLEENNNIKSCYTLNSESNSESSKSKWSLRRNKVISIKKFRRVFKKKKIDIILCNIEDINPYLKTFIKDSIYICRGSIYYYGKKKDIDITYLKSKYDRYKVTYKEEKLKDGIVFIININNAKTYRIKELWYKIYDGVNSASNLLSDYLTN